MIIEPVPEDAPIRQGDIFRGIPRADFDLDALPILDDDGFGSRSWSDINDQVDGSDVLVRLRPVIGIVISQDCDATRSRDVSLCEIRPFHDVEAKAKDQADGPKKWIGLVTQQARFNQKWFYIPADPLLGDAERRAVDFRVVLRVGLANLQDAREQLRIGRLNSVASEHFRERLSEFFRRYPYDEWYPLTPVEYERYATSVGEPVEPFPWQASSP